MRGTILWLLVFGGSGGVRGAGLSRTFRGAFADVSRRSSVFGVDFSYQNVVFDKSS